MDKSGDCDSDGSISWEDFFGSSSDLVPTLLTMYDTLIAQTLPDSTHIQIGEDLIQSEAIPWDSESSKSNGVEMNTKTTSTTTLTTVTQKTPPINTETLKSKVVNGNCEIKMDSKSNGSTQAQYKLGLLSRSFSKWSSRITDKSSHRSPTRENSKFKSKMTTGTQPRPLSVNSTFSSTSASSCSSESSNPTVTSPLPTVSGIAPKASPEKDDCVSDEENSFRSCAKGTKSKEITRCYESTSKETITGDGGRRQISSPMSSQGKPKFYDSNLSYMDRVVMEIVDTERVYVTDLQEIISGYLNHWRQNMEEKPSELELITELFSNIEEIYNFNSEFVTQLEGCGLDPVAIAKCFVTKNEGFSVYTLYCTHYPRTMFILSEMMGQESSAKYFRERQASLGHFLPLGSYLLKPVQRILKYHLLLQNIVKHYEGGEGGYAAIVEALSAMTNIAHHINSMKRRHEHAVRVQEIQSLLYGWEGEDLTTYGELCAEGTFRVYGAKALRHVFLFDKMLLITKKKEDGILGYKSHIMCSNLMLIESVPGELLSFHVIPFDNPRFQCTLQAKNPEQKREWTLQLKRVILENYSAVIPSHARQLVMELGQYRPEDGSFMTEKVQSKRQHSAPEYLERRKQEKDRRKAESTLRAKLRRARKNDPINSKDSLSISRRNNRRTSVDSALCTPSQRKGDNAVEMEGMDRKMSISSCPAGITEKRLVMKLSGWRRKSEPGFYLNGIKEKGSGLTSPSHDNSELMDSSNSIHEDGNEEEEANLSTEDTVPNLEQRRESVEEIVGQLVMQNREFQRILSKQRLTHLRRSLARQHTERVAEYESASDGEGESSLEKTNPTQLNSNHSQTSSSNGIGSSSDVNGDSTENISNEGEKEGLISSNAKNVQRTVSDPGNKSTLTPRRFINGPLSHYDPISLLWSSFRRSEPKGRRNVVSGATELKSEGGNKVPIRHTHSFTCSRKDSDATSPPDSKVSESSLPHGDSGVFPNSFTSDSSSSSEANLPTLPAVWLKQQGEHLATPSTKSGSLPRSFQVGSHAPGPLPSNNNGRVESPGVKSRLRDFSKYPVPDRPFTIASDKPSPSDLSLEEMEEYVSQFHEEATDAELSPITASLENLSLHPDHKIYHRSSTSKSSSIKHILLSVTNRLSGIKGNRHPESGSKITCNGKAPINFGLNSNISPAHSTDLNGKSSSGEPGVNKSSKLKTKEDSDSENGESVTSSGFGSIGSTDSTNNFHSKKIGARLAHCADSDYAISKFFGFREVPITTQQRPGSVLSSSSTVTSSSSEDKEVGEGHVQMRRNSRGLTARDLYLSYIDQDSGENGRSDSDGSADSFYERSFEAIENFLESEFYGDGAIYQDQQSLITLPSKSTIPLSSSFWLTTPDSVNDKESGLEAKNGLNLPLGREMGKNPESKKSRTVCSDAILEKLKHLEQCAQFTRDCLPSPSFEGIKSIEQRRKELELWKSGLGNREDESETSSQHSTSTINTVIELSPLKSTSFPSSRRCSDTESSGGNSPLTERASTRTYNGRSQSHGQLSVGGSVGTPNSKGSDSMSKGWVKLVVGKLEGDDS